MITTTPPTPRTPRPLATAPVPAPSRSLVKWGNAALALIIVEIVAMLGLLTYLKYIGMF